MAGILIANNAERAQARLEETQSQLERRAYELFEAEGRTHGRALKHWLEAEREMTRAAAAELVRGDDGSLFIRAEVPGFQPDELELDLATGFAVLYGTAHERNGSGQHLLNERGGPVVCKFIPLPAGVQVQPDDVTAHLSRGLLDVHIRLAHRDAQPDDGARRSFSPAPKEPGKNGAAQRRRGRSAGSKAGAVVKR